MVSRFETAEAANRIGLEDSHNNTSIFSHVPVKRSSGCISFTVTFLLDWVGNQLQLPLQHQLAPHNHVQIIHLTSHNERSIAFGEVFDFNYGQVSFVAFNSEPG